MGNNGIKAGLSLVRMVPLVLAPALTAALHAQTSGKHRITHEDVWLMPRIGAPVPSPDGHWVAFEVTQPAYDDSAKVDDLWIVPTDGSTPPRRLTTAKGRETEPAWSPDSRRIAFSAKRDGNDVSQVYVLDIGGGGEAGRVTDLSGGAWAPHWRPDGRALVVTTSVWRGAQDEAANRRIGEARKAEKYKARTYEGGGRTRYWDRWLEDRTSQLAVVDIDSAAPPRLLFAASRLARNSGYTGRLTDEREVLDAGWTPDGSGVIFAASVNADRVAYELARADLFLVPAEGGEPLPITSGPDSYERPRFSPDGRTLAAIVRVKPPLTYSLDRLVTWRWPDRASRTIVTAKFDRSVSSWAFTPAGDSLYLTAEDSGHEKLYRLATQRGEVQLVHALEVGAYTSLAIPERDPSTSLFARWESAVSPPEIYRLQTAGQRVPLTAMSRARAQKIDWQPVREFTFRSRAGRTIHNMLVLPPGFDSTQSYPLFVAMHGGPHNMWRDYFFVRWNYHLLSAPGLDPVALGKPLPGQLSAIRCQRLVTTSTRLQTRRSAGSPSLIVSASALVAGATVGSSPIGFRLPPRAIAALLTMLVW